MLLDQLLGDAPRGEFIEQHYLRLPYSRAGGCQQLASYADWTTIERLLAHPDADVIVGREGKRWEGATPTTVAAAREVLSAGYMFGVRHAHQIDPSLAELAGQFQHEFAAPIDVHLYCTPAGHPGFGWHYDAEEVFILQTHGKKEWWLRKNSVNPWPLVETLPENMRHEREIMPMMKCRLEAGDWLYIPAGYWHRTHALADESESISLSVGVMALSAMDLFDALRGELLPSLLWRQRLPPLGAAQMVAMDELRERYRAVLRELERDLAKRLSSDAFLTAYLEQHRRETA
jgi:ribosomal protein L16 Arg81 hydroxylase